MDTEEARATAQRTLKQWWPSIYAFINGLFSYLLVQGKKITLDVIQELTGKG